MQTEFEKWELVEVSDCGEKWEKVLFKSYRGDGWNYPFLAQNGRSFKFCRKVSEEVIEEKYAVFVVWGLAPTKKNHTFESAKIEAERLSNKENKQAYIVELIWVQKPRVVSEFSSLSS